MTIVLTSFMPCSAKLPIIALIAGALFPNTSWIAPSAYFAGIGAIVISGILLKKTQLFSGDPSPFVMELPPYHLPSFRSVWKHTWDRSQSFVVKAGSVIFLAVTMVWFLSSFNLRLEAVEQGESILAGLGHLLAPLFVPLGWGNWRASVATLTGLLAKENVVGTFGVLYGAGEVLEDGSNLWSVLSESFSQVSAYSFLLFNLLCAPCFAAIGAIKREMGNWYWTLFAVGYQCALAYAAAFFVYQIGRVVVLGEPINALTAVAAAGILGVGALLFHQPTSKTSLRSQVVKVN